MKLIHWLDAHMEEVILGILLVMITCVSFIQVILRNIPWIHSLTWAEEFCRFCWIWSVFMSLPYTLRMGNMLRVTALLDILPEKVMKVLNIMSYVVTTLCMLLLAYYSVIVVGNIYASGETSPAMLWPMWAVYSIMIVGFVLAVVRGIQQIIIHVINFNGKELNTAEQAMMDAKYETINAKEMNTAGGDV